FDKSQEVFSSFCDSSSRLLQLSRLVLQVYGPHLRTAALDSFNKGASLSVYDLKMADDTTIAIFR
ncbi:hypothetical protein TNCV_1299641, partial [Trichonephila clavipes]